MGSKDRIRLMLEWYQANFNQRQLGKMRVISDYYYRKVITNIRLSDCYMDRIFTSMIEFMIPHYPEPYPRFGLNPKNRMMERLNNVRR